MSQTASLATITAVALAAQQQITSQTSRKLAAAGAIDNLATDLQSLVERDQEADRVVASSLDALGSILRIVALQTQTSRGDLLVRLEDTLAGMGNNHAISLEVGADVDALLALPAAAAPEPLRLADEPEEVATCAANQPVEAPTITPEAVQSAPATSSVAGAPEAVASLPDAPEPKKTRKTRADKGQKRNPSARSVERPGNRPDSAPGDMTGPSSGHTDV